MDGAGIVGECNVQEVREENPTLFYPNTAVPVRACPVWIQWWDPRKGGTWWDRRTARHTSPAGYELRPRVGGAEKWKLRDTGDMAALWGAPRPPHTDWQGWEPNGYEASAHVIGRLLNYAGKHGPTKGRLKTTRLSKSPVEKSVTTHRRGKRLHSLRPYELLKERKKKN